MYSQTHPSIFQSINNGDIEDPNKLWKCKLDKQLMDSTHYQESRYDPNDPPYNKHEIERLGYLLEPLSDTTNSEHNYAPTLLFFSFVSKNNVDTLMYQLLSTVKRLSGYSIGEQSKVTLLLSMEYKYNYHARNIDEERTGRKALNAYIKSEVQRLNELVINEIAPIIINEVESYLQFQTDYFKVSHEALARPVDTSITGTTDYRSQNDVFGGNTKYW
jgi:hypothetical protein